jgi:hypothetical protein
MPRAGFSGFPFISDEPEIDLSVYPPDASYLVLESDLFTEAALADSLKKAMEFCQEADLHWLIGAVTEFLFKYLEAKFAFEVLKNLYDSVKRSFDLLKASENIKIGFARIFLKGAAQTRLRLKDVVVCYTRKEGKSFAQDVIPEYAKKFLGEKEVPMAAGLEPAMDSALEDVWQIIEVKCPREQLSKLAAKTFYRDVLGADQGWDAPMVRRYLFTTRAPLPNATSIMEIERYEVVEILKVDFFAAKLSSFASKVKATIGNIEAVLPPSGRTKFWGQSIPGVGPSPLISYMRVILNASPRTRPYYSFVKDVFMGVVTDDAPPRIEKLVIEIRHLFVHIITLCADLSEMTVPTPEDMEVLAIYCSIWGLTLKLRQER